MMTWIARIPVPRSTWESVHVWAIRLPAILTMRCVFLMTMTMMTRLQRLF